MDSNGRVPKSVIEDGLAGITVHEIGHTLGLRHNFKGSAHTPHSQIYNKKYTIEHGASASVMDYVNPIVAPTAAEQSASLVFPGGHTIGAYDQLAIKYGYTEVQGEKSGWQHPIVAAIAKEMGSTGLMFGTDNDAALSEIEMDPLAKRYDMTGDPVRWQLDQLKIAQRLQEVDPKYATSDTFSSGFTVITGAIWQSLTLQVSAVDNAVDWLGGRIINHAFPGDRPSAEAGPVRPVSSAYQKGALGILTTFIGNPFYRYSAGFSNNAKAVATQDNLVAYGSGFGFQAPMPYGVRALNIRRTFDSCVEAAIGKVLDAKKLLRIHAVDIALTRAHPSATPWAPDDWPVDKGEGGVGVYAVLRAVSNAVWAQWNCQVISQPVEWPLISTFTEKICKLHDITTPGSEAAEAAAVGSLAQINVYAAAVREEMLQNVTDHLTSGSCSGAPVPVGAKEFVVSMQRMLNKTVS